MSEAVDHLGINVHLPRLAKIEEILEHEVSPIAAFPDALKAVALLQEGSFLVAVFGNLKYPHGRAVKRLFPTMDGFGLSCEIGLVKPDPRMFQVACEMIGVKSDN